MICSKKIISIHQPNYIPWLGYFYKIVQSDVFVFLDDVQFVKGTVATRNSIKGKDGKEVPLSASVRISKGAFQKYNEIEPEYSNKWNAKHLNKIRDAYLKAPYFKEIFPVIEEWLKKPHANLAAMNIEFIRMMVEKMGVQTQLEIASELEGDFGEKNDRNLNLTKYFGGTVYLSGTGAKKYNDEKMFNDQGVELEYSSFEHPVYEQMHGEFVSHLSIIDAVFNIGYEETYKLIS